MLQKIKIAVENLIRDSYDPTKRLLDLYVLVVNEQEKALAEAQETPLAQALPVIVNDGKQSFGFTIFTVKGERTTSKIIAIKLVRQHYALGLREAKEYLDSLERGTSNVKVNVYPDSPRW